MFVFSIMRMGGSQDQKKKKCVPDRSVAFGSVGTVLRWEGMWPSQWRANDLQER